MQRNDLILIKITHLQIHGDNIIACSATEVADRIAVIEGLEEEQKSSAAQRCARIYAECNRKPGEEQYLLYYQCIIIITNKDVQRNSKSQLMEATGPRHHIPIIFFIGVVPLLLCQHGVLSFLIV